MSLLSVSYSKWEERDGTQCAGSTPKGQGGPPPHPSALSWAVMWTNLTSSTHPGP